jgi:hypothetical protein
MPGTRDRKALGTILASLGMLAGLHFEARGDDPDVLAGTPASLAVAPADATLVGRRATRQLIATGTYPEGSATSPARSSGRAPTRPWRSSPRPAASRPGATARR